MIQNILVQAGGLGERAGRYSKNKPKCLISINGKPLLFHLIDKFNTSNFYIIFTEKSKNLEVFKKLLELHPDYKEKIKVLTTNNSGNSAEVKNIASKLDSQNFLLCWSDIIFDLPAFDENKNAIFLSKKMCRWKINEKKEINRNDGMGIFGVFYFSDAKSSLSFLNNDGSIMNTIQRPNFLYEMYLLHNEKEFGLEDELTSYYINNAPSRFYNSIEFFDEYVIKNSKNKNLIKRENLWYDTAKKLDFKSFPKKINSDPFTIQRIIGSNSYEYLIENKNSNVIDKIFFEIDNLHKIKIFDFDKNTKKLYKESVYLNETISRIEIIKNIHDHFKQETLIINGKTCINFLLEKNINILIDKLKKLVNIDEEFVFIHGDPILSNILIDKENNIKFIDPRGYFFVDGCHGTKLYDYSKLYFSSVHNFDTFNRKLFDLEINKDGFDIFIDKQFYNSMFDKKFEQKFTVNENQQIKLLSATMWIRFASCVLDDYDSIIASTAYGLLKLNELS